MKKSEHFKVAAVAVLMYDKLPAATKVEVLKSLLDAENMERLCESYSEKEEQ